MGIADRVNRRSFVMGASLTALQSARVMGANDRIGVCVVGCGTRGLIDEVLEFERESNVNVAGVCDIWHQQRENAAAKVTKAGLPQPKLLSHYDEVLASKEIDAVLIATPDHQHCTQLVSRSGMVETPRLQAK